MGPKRSKNQLRRKKAKLRKLAKSGEPTETNVTQKGSENGSDPKNDPTSSTQLQSQNDAAPAHDALKHEPQATEDTPLLASEFAHVFKKFDTAAILPPQSTTVARIDYSDSNTLLESDDDSEDELHDQKPPKAKKRRSYSVSMSDLKASTSRPQLVEWFDCDAPDPYLVVLLRARLNHVDVAGHWQQKKDYLSSKRGASKAPFRLPKFIRDTGISEMRDHDQESLKKLQRDRVQPKMNKLDIDYQRLHDAFFKHQTKPRLLAFGELYSEGREKTDQHRQAVAAVKPGKISKELRAAVGMSTDETGIPPWITLMQEFGKPPSYKHLIIPGVDEEYKNTGYRLSSDENLSTFSVLDETWGRLEEGEESDPESDLEASSSEDKAGGADNELRIEKEPEAEEEVPEQGQRIEITEYSKNYAESQLPIKESTKQIGELFAVIEEKRVESGNGLLKSTLAYELPKK